MSTSNEMEIVVELPESEEERKRVKGFFSSDDETGVVKISPERLGASLKAACEAMSTALHHTSQIGDFGLKEVEVKVQVTAEGGIQFLALTKLSGAGAIKLKFVK